MQMSGLLFSVCALPEKAQNILMDMKGLVEPMQNTNRSVRDMIVTGRAAARKVSAALSVVDSPIFVCLQASSKIYV